MDKVIINNCIIKALILPLKIFTIQKIIQPHEGNYSFKLKV